MSARALLWLAGLVFLTALVLRLHGAASRDETAVLRREEGAYERVRQTILDKYVGDVNRQELFYGALEGMAVKLDPHSAFWPPRKNKVERTATTGHFGGLGMTIYQDKQHNLIIMPMPLSPSARAGLWPLDRIVKVDGQTVAQLSIEDVSDLIRGEPGTPVRLTVGRRGKADLLDFTVTREMIRVESVPEALLLTAPESLAARIPPGTPRIGYVQLTRFQEDSAADLTKALEDLEAQGLAALVLDLRQNTGGLLNTAVDICDLFLSEGGIVSVRGRASNGQPPPEEVYVAHASATDRAYPLALLVDSSSASASEIVAGCLKDHRRAVLVGEKTYGKGSVQTIIPVDLGDWGEAALKLTTAKFYTPNGTVINGKGVEPDYLVPFTSEQLDGLLKERLRRQLDRDPALRAAYADQEAALLGEPAASPATPPKAAKPAEPFHDLQLEKAVEVLSKQLGANQ